MKRKKTIAWLATVSILALAVGCSKTEEASPAPRKVEQAPVTNEGLPMGTSQPLRKGLTKLETTNDASKPSLDAGAKVIETVMATNQTSRPPREALGTVLTTNGANKLPVATGVKAGETDQPPAKVDSSDNTVPPSPKPNSLPDSSDRAKMAAAALPQDQVVQGLEEALGKGLQQAIARLGHDNGFLTNLQVRIPMPEKLQPVESLLHKLGEDKLVDDFVSTINHAAEQAVPEAAGVFADSLKQMTIQDAKSILTGPDDAATQYFKRTTQTNLYAKFYPIVQKATDKVGVTEAYKKLVDKANLLNTGNLGQQLGRLGNLLGSSLFDKDSLDVDAYVTNKAMDGLYKTVGEEEKRIRQNPLARTSELLQKVFGVLKR